MAGSSSFFGLWVMKDAVLFVLAIVAFLGFSVLIVWVRDRGGMLGMVITRTFGALSLLFGLIIAGFVIYDFFSSTKSFWTLPLNVLLVCVSIPTAMISVGAKWLFGAVPEVKDQQRSSEKNRANEAIQPKILAEN